MKYNQRKELTAFLPVWVEPWMKQALLILLSIIQVETERVRAESGTLDSSVRPEELLARCVSLGMSEWEVLANEISPQLYTTARFITACILFEKNALYEIQSQLDRARMN